MVSVERWAQGVCVALFVPLLLVSAVQAAPPEQAPTATPIPVNVAPVAQPTEPSIQIATLTWTPQPTSGIMLEAREFANVRAEPDTNSAQLGVIRAGETYNVIGRYFSWIQFQFPSSPNGRGWVFGDLVNIIGNENEIPEVEFSAVPTLAPVDQAATQTLSIVTQTPGGLLTATAASSAGGTGGIPGGVGGTPGVLPTFTYPPNIVPIAPTVGSPISAEATEAPVTETRTTSSSLPPILPILALFGAGLLGLAVSAVRRG